MRRRYSMGRSIRGSLFVHQCRVIRRRILPCLRVVPNFTPHETCICIRSPMCPPAAEKRSPAADLVREGHQVRVAHLVAAQGDEGPRGMVAHAPDLASPPKSVVREQNPPDAEASSIRRNSIAQSGTQSAPVHTITVCPMATSLRDASNPLHSVAFSTFL